MYCLQEKGILKIDQERFVYNMATGSGKTLLMAGLILDYYKRGYRDFIFFVHRTAILEKTRINFLRKGEEKYLFKEKIVIEGKVVFIQEINDFSESNPEYINIHFTTINTIHVNMENEREGRIARDDFIDRKVVFLGDEYHHYHNKKWGDTMESLVEQNSKNVYLGFTATLNYEAQGVVEKDKRRVVMKYDLADFRRDRFSKELVMCLTGADKQGRMIQSLIVNLYRGLVAFDNKAIIGKELKPIILYKSKNKDPSKESYNEFTRLIDNLSDEHITLIRENLNKPEFLNRAFQYFNNKEFTDAEIARRISNNFKKPGGRYNVLSLEGIGDYTDLSADVQELLNTLEKGSNPIRAIFTVDKLNEGWDVQNLFDIVRLYDTQQTGGSNKGQVGKATIQEIQLLGRGARYWPFKFEDKDEFMRKFDNLYEHDLRVLEELHFYANNNHRYISELNTGMKHLGFDPDFFVLGAMVEKSLKLKKRFVESEFYNSGKVVINEKIPCNHRHVIPFNQLSVVHQAPITFHLSSSTGKEFRLLDSEDMRTAEAQDLQVTKTVPLSEFPQHVLRYSMSEDWFFHFDNLVKLYPNLSSMSEFITEYLGSLEITFIGEENRFGSISPSDYLLASCKLLGAIKDEIKENWTENTASDWIAKDIKDIFQKTIILKVPANTAREAGQQWVAEVGWYAHNQTHGTSEEQPFIESFNQQFNWRYLYKFEEIHILRNEKELKIIDESGKGFQPDFILFCKERNSGLVRQVFIEPKGSHLAPHDQWKNDFLKEIQAENFRMSTDSGEILIGAVSFYNQDNHKLFYEELDKILELPSEQKAKPKRLREVLGDSDQFSDVKSMETFELIEALNQMARAPIEKEVDWDGSIDTDELSGGEQEEEQTNETNWAKFTVDELKEYLRAADLPVSGTKPVLIARITEAEPAKEPSWAEMDVQQIKRFLKVFPIRRNDFMVFLDNSD
jgi:type III restriction enzyme